jgi:hypothetical protein
MKFANRITVTDLSRLETAGRPDSADDPIVR